MFKELGQIMGLAKQMPKIREEIDRLQQRVAQISAEGDAGAGMVRIRVNGKQEVVAVAISEDVIRLADREMLEELVRGATNQALERVRQLTAEETGKMAANLGLPAGLGLPGMTTPAT
jgi:DNA-binding YbaB/EbfC family protein